MSKIGHVGRSIDVIVFGLGGIEDNNTLRLIDSTVDLVGSTSIDQTNITSGRSRETQELVEIVDVKSFVDLGNTGKNSVDEIFLNRLDVLSVGIGFTEEFEDGFDLLGDVEDIDFIQSGVEENIDLFGGEFVEVHSQDHVDDFFLLGNEFAGALL